MHLPTPQFSRLVAVLAFDLTDPSLDSMILAWDHIASRFIDRIRDHREAAGRIESIRLLSVHDAVRAVFGSDSGYIFKSTAEDRATGAALAAAAQASHDILASVFRSPTQLTDLNDTLEESLALIVDPGESAAGVRVGSQSAATYLHTFSPFIGKVRAVVEEGPHGITAAARFARERQPAGGGAFQGGFAWRKSA